MTRRDWLAEDPRRIRYEAPGSILVILVGLAPVRPVERLYAYQEAQEDPRCIDVPCTRLDG